MTNQLTLDMFKASDIDHNDYDMWVMVGEVNYVFRMGYDDFCYRMSSKSFIEESSHYERIEAYRWLIESFDEMAEYICHRLEKVTGWEEDGDGNLVAKFETK